MSEEASKHEVTWVDRGLEPQCPADPAHPLGKVLDIAGALCRADHPRCTVPLPYPARRIGHYLVYCTACECTVAATTAGRADDPRAVIMPCRRMLKSELH